jgi:hypothetical protein
MSEIYVKQRPTAEEFHAEIGGSKWVLARRSRHIVERYGPHVICLSPQRYADAERLALLRRTEGYE